MCLRKSVNGVLLLLLLPPLVRSQAQGWLHSPNHPLEYPNNSKKNWTLCAPPGFALSLTLIHLDLENSTQCEHDALMIFRGKDLIKSLCGNMSFTEMQSSVNPCLHASGSCLSIYFYSDESLPQVHTGFNAFYQTQDVDECANQSNPCSHFCNNFIGGFRCSCPHGYLLNNNNNRTCDVITCGPPKHLRNGYVKFVKGSKNEYLSVIEYHCNEPYYVSIGKQNGNYTCSAAQKWRETGNNIIPSCHYVCGHHKLPSRYSRIFGGKPAPSGSFPWQVLLRVHRRRAGAIIIGEQWIMTAAHNFHPFMSTIENIEVYVGHNNIKELGKYTSLNVSSVHVHSNYTSENDNDIGLIKLKSPFTFSENIRPVCLPPKHHKLKHYRGWVSGYGMTNTTLPDELMYVQLFPVDQKECRDFFINANPITDNMFCAKNFEGGDACQGDSGSAFVVEENGVNWVLGIVSWGKMCGEMGVYTKVSQYLDWINKTMSEN